MSARRYRDFATTLGGPVVRDRVWFFAGYQYLRDYDSQPGTDPDSSQEARAGQSLRQDDLASGAGMAVDAELSRRILDQPGNPDDHEAAGSDPGARGLGAGHQFRPSGAHIGDHGVGSQRRAVALPPGNVPVDREPDISTVSMTTAPLERRATADRRGRTGSHDRQGDRHAAHDEAPGRRP